jgi:hypothetical protein
MGRESRVQWQFISLQKQINKNQNENFAIDLNQLGAFYLFFPFKKKKKISESVCVPQPTATAARSSPVVGQYFLVYLSIAR